MFAGVAEAAWQSGILWEAEDSSHAWIMGSEPIPERIEVTAAMACSGGWHAAGGGPAESARGVSGNAARQRHPQSAPEGGIS